MAACSSRGARSEVPETLLPTVPLKSSMPRATPYSVMEVPRMGMVPVAAEAAWRAAVPLARIRSTPSETKEPQMVVQVAESPAAFCSFQMTFSAPSASSTASLKPWVAASSASCWTSWQMPMVKGWASVVSPTPSSDGSMAGLLPQAARERAIQAARDKASNFFFIRSISFALHWMRKF